MLIPLSIRRLSPSTQALVGTLTSWKTLNQRWLGADDTLDILERIGEAGEPLAIPALMSFGFKPNNEIRSKARSVIRQLFVRIPVESLPLLDEALRTSWAHLHDWYGMRVEAITELGGETEADRLYLTLLTCHQNGFIRAEALRVVLAIDPSDTIIPFAIIRLADWVPEVRLEAEKVIHSKLVPRNAGCFVRCLELLNRIAGNSRYRPTYSEWIDELLMLPECAADLRRGIESQSREVRRSSCRIAAQGPDAGQDLVMPALGDRDVIVRKWAFAMGQKLGFPGDLMDRAAIDPYGPIRRIAFEAAEANASISTSLLSRFLFDRSAAIRHECQSIFSKRLGQSPADYYRTAIRGTPTRNADICALGLAETGDRSDAAAISALLQSSSARVRRAAVRALRRLGAEGMNTVLLRVVSSDVPSVAREAAFSIFVGRAVPPSDLWNAALNNPDSRVHRSALRLMKHSEKWQQIQYYLRSASDPALRECAVEMIRLWVRRYNSTFVQATAGESQALTALMEASAGHLPKDLARELGLIVKTVGSYGERMGT
jgi:hypothetical protein